MQQKGCLQRGPQGQAGGLCKDVGFGVKGGRNFQKACLLKDRMSSRLHSCECYLRRESHTVWRSSQEGGIEGPSRGGGGVVVTFWGSPPSGCRANTQNV